MIEKKSYKDVPKEERAVLVGIITQTQKEDKLNEYLDELEFLAHTAGAVTVKRFTQRMDKPEGSTFIGSGKVKQIAEFAKENQIDLVIFDDELSPAQQRNLEEEIGLKIVDRTTLILDIFAARAQTAHAKTQVELAQYQYLLPRLSKMWSHHDRIKGGIGMKGAGEKEIETDRRIVRDKITLLKERLKDIDKQMTTQRKSRGELIRVALVGYTNVGKSTLMNLLSKSEVFAENKLFATLDTTVRKIVIGNLPFLLSDTVGFIRKLPHDLVASFKSTLDEVREADILLHVVDISHPCFEDHINVVNETIKDIGAVEKDTILVFNKIDAFVHEEQPEDDLGEKQWQNYSIKELQSMWQKRTGIPCMFISAAKKQNIEELRDLLFNKVKEMHTARYPYQDLFFK